MQKIKKRMFEKINIKNRSIAVKYVDFPSNSVNGFIIYPICDGLGFQTNIEDLEVLGLSPRLMDYLKSSLQKMNDVIGKEYTKFRKKELSASYTKRLDEYYTYINIVMLILSFLVIQYGIHNQNKTILLIGLCCFGIIILIAAFYFISILLIKKIKLGVFTNILSPILENHIEEINNKMKEEGFYIEAPSDFFWLKVSKFSE